MIKKGHLENYSLTLISKAPVFIGSGKEITKKEYYFNGRNKQIHIINFHKFMELLIERNLIDEYEKYILHSRNYLDSFFIGNRITAKEINEITDYTINSGDAIVEGYSLKNIQQFIRDSYDRPYIPGSSLKGAIRTILLIKMILDDKNTRLSENNANKLMQCAQRDKHNMRSKRYLKREIETIEANYLHKLGLNEKRADNAVNSLMRGISISDSGSIAFDNMVLCSKKDLSTKGNIKTINNVRECIKPGSNIEFKLTLDKSILKTIDLDFIKSAINTFGEYYSQEIDSKFEKPFNAVDENFENAIILGGGAGFFSKTIVYPLLGRHALGFVSDYMSNNFRQHKHEKDKHIGISPHMLKHTEYEGKSYHFGVCGIDIK